MMRTMLSVAVLTIVFSAFGCKRETRILREAPPGSAALNSVQVSGINPGAHPLQPTPPSSDLYQESAYAVSEGQRLFEQYNCVGCHAHGGGGMGPPLMDNRWIYGSEPANIFATIMQGRPNGMPSFRNLIPEYQAWEIAAYVRSLSGLLPSDVAPSRTDEMDVKPSESSTPKQTPTGITGVPVTAPETRP
jgi:cytochrome c oxidase cbb3-type subunit 3